MEQSGICSFNSLWAGGGRMEDGSEGCSGRALCLCVGLAAAGVAGRPGGGQALPEGISLVASLGFQRAASSLPVQLHPAGEQPTSREGEGARYKGGSAVTQSGTSCLFRSCLTLLESRAKKPALT